VELVLGIAIMESMRINSGFTLVEMLVVVAILLILSTAGLSNFIFSIVKSHDTQRKQDLATIVKGIEAFVNDFGSYPDGDAAGRMVACDDDNSGLVACNFGGSMKAYFGGTAQTYLSRLPADPVPGQVYFYEKTASGFNLYASLENANDPGIKTGLSTSCGTGITCNYQLTRP